MFESVGQIVVHNDWWICIHVCPDLGRYYRMGFNWFSRFKGYGIGDTRWGPHISFVRGEMPTKLNIWQSLQNKEIRFFYEPEYCTNGYYVWFPVICDEAFDIRESLGLERVKPNIKLHLTLGVYHREGPNDKLQIEVPD